MKTGEAGRKRIKDLIEKGRSKGVLTYKEIMDMLEEIDLEPDQIEKVYDTLENLGIDIVDEESDDVDEEDDKADQSLPE